MAVNLIINKVPMPLHVLGQARDEAEAQQILEREIKLMVQHNELGEFTETLKSMIAAGKVNVNRVLAMVEEAKKE